MAIGRHQIIHECLVSDLASNCDQARLYLVTDGASVGDVTTGGGTYRGLVAYYGGAWNWI